MWCAKWDLNPHILRYRNLNPACLPISPFAHCDVDNNIHQICDKSNLRRNIPETGQLTGHLKIKNHFMSRQLENMIS